MADFPEYSHRYRSTKVYPSSGYECAGKITVDACLHYLQGNSRPYFSVTADISIPGRPDIETGGCMHDEVLKYWPKLAPVVALHLSTDEGLPMHAEANGWYQLAGYYGGAGQMYHAGNSPRNFPLPEDRRDPAKAWQTTEHRLPTADECLASFAEYVRISVDEARTLAAQWLTPQTVMVKWAEVLEYPTWKETRARYAAWLETQRPRFKAEADAAIALLDSLIIRRRWTRDGAASTVEALAPIDPRD